MCDACVCSCGLCMCTQRYAAIHFYSMVYIIAGYLPDWQYQWYEQIVCRLRLLVLHRCGWHHKMAASSFIRSWENSLTVLLHGPYQLIAFILVWALSLPLIALPLHFVEEPICLTKHLKAKETEGVELAFSQAVCLYMHCIPRIMYVCIFSY